MSDVRWKAARGFTLVELLVVVGLIGVISAIAVPMFGTAMANFRVSGDARALSNNIAMTKMRAASVFSKVRLYVDLTGGSYHLEAFDKTTPLICCWVAVPGNGNVYLSQSVLFGSGAVNAPPPNTTQPSVLPAANCKSNTNVDVAGTACVIFNSRGLPVDPTGNPVIDTLYITNGSAVYGIAVAASGMIRSWKTGPAAAPTWVLQ